MHIIQVYIGSCESASEEEEEEKEEGKKEETQTEWNLQKSRDSYAVCSLMHFQCLEQCLIHR